MSEIAHFINGQIVNGNSSRRQDVFNPATGNADKDLTSILKKWEDQNLKMFEKHPTDLITE